VLRMSIGRSFQIVGPETRKSVMYRLQQDEFNEVLKSFS